MFVMTALYAARGLSAEAVGERRAVNAGWMPNTKQKAKGKKCITARAKKVPRPNYASRLLLRDKSRTHAKLDLAIEHDRTPALTLLGELSINANVVHGISAPERTKKEKET